MRVLTPEEIAAARHSGLRQWRPVWRYVLVRDVLCTVILAIVIVNLSGWGVLVALLLYLWIVVHSSIVLGYGFRKWRREFEADLCEAKALQRTAKVYDRFRIFSLPKARVIWADGAELGLDMRLSEEDYKRIRVGGMICVDYLPRSQFVIAVRKLAAQ